MGGQRNALKIGLFVAGGVIVLAGILWQPLLYLVQGDPGTSEKIGSAVPALTLEDADGKSATLEAIAIERSPKKDKKALYVLWATWCEPCVRELPVLEENQARFAESGYPIVLVNYDGLPKEKTVPEVKAWLTAQGVNLSTYFDFNSSLIDEWAIEALPFSFAANSEGQVSWAHMGYLDWNSVELP